MRPFATISKKPKQNLSFKFNFILRGCLSFSMLLPQKYINFGRMTKTIKQINICLCKSVTITTVQLFQEQTKVHLI